MARGADPERKDSVIRERARERTAPGRTVDRGGLGRGRGGAPPPAGGPPDLSGRSVASVLYLQRTVGNRVVRRMLAENAAADAASATASVQLSADASARAAPSASPPAPPPKPTGAPGAIFASATAGPGGQVPYRAEMERSFGMDFSGVTAHVGQERSMALLGANAATDGATVAFAEKSPGREVVAHELAHVAQHRTVGGAGISRDVSQPHDPAEREAEAIAAQVAAYPGRPVAMPVAPASAPIGRLHLDRRGDLIGAGLGLSDAQIGFLLRLPDPPYGSPEVITLGQIVVGEGIPAARIWTIATGAHYPLMPDLRDLIALSTYPVFAVVQLANSGFAIREMVDVVLDVGDQTQVMLSVADVRALFALRGTHPVPFLTALGIASVQTGYTIANLVAVAGTDPGLAVPDVVALLPVAAARGLPFVTTLANAVVALNLPAADLVQLSQIPLISAADVVNFAIGVALHGWPLARIVHVATTVPGLPHAGLLNLFALHAYAAYRDDGVFSRLALLAANLAPLQRILHIVNQVPVLPPADLEVLLQLHNFAAYRDDGVMVACATQVVGGFATAQQLVNLVTAVNALQPAGLLALIALFASHGLPALTTLATAVVNTGEPVAVLVAIAQGEVGLPADDVVRLVPVALAHDNAYAITLGQGALVQNLPVAGLVQLSVLPGITANEVLTLGFGITHNGWPLQRVQHVVNTVGGLGAARLIQLFGLHAHVAYRDDNVFAQVAQVLIAGVPMARILHVLGQVPALTPADLLALLQLHAGVAYRNDAVLAGLADQVVTHNVPAARIVALVARIVGLTPAHLDDLLTLPAYSVDQLVTLSNQNVPIDQMVALVTGISQGAHGWPAAGNVQALLALAPTHALLVVTALGVAVEQHALQVARVVAIAQGVAALPSADVVRLVPVAIARGDVFAVALGTAALGQHLPVDLLVRLTTAPGISAPQVIALGDGVTHHGWPEARIIHVHNTVPGLGLAGLVDLFRLHAHANYRDDGAFVMVAQHVVAGVPLNRILHVLAQVPGLPPADLHALLQLHALGAYQNDGVLAGLAGDVVNVPVAGARVLAVVQGENNIAPAALHALLALAPDYGNNADLVAFATQVVNGVNVARLVGLVTAIHAGANAWITPGHFQHLIPLLGGYLDAPLVQLATASAQPNHPLDGMVGMLQAAGGLPVADAISLAQVVPRHNQLYANTLAAAVVAHHLGAGLLEQLSQIPNILAAQVIALADGVTNHAWPLNRIQHVVVNVAALPTADLVALFGLEAYAAYQNDGIYQAVAQAVVGGVPLARIFHMLVQAPALQPVDLGNLLQLHAHAAYQNDGVMASLAQHVTLNAVPSARILAVVTAVNAVAPPDLWWITSLVAHYPNNADLIAMANRMVVGTAAGRTAQDMTTWAAATAGNNGGVYPPGQILADLFGALAGYNQVDLMWLFISLPGLNGAQIIQVDGFLAPLAPGHVVLLLHPLVVDGLNGANILQLVTRYNALGLDGNQIWGTVHQGRGSMNTVGADVVDITVPAGARILSGPHLLHQANTHVGAANLLLYPTSNINPLGRAENQLWQDCDPAVQIGGDNLGDRATRQRLALDALMRLGGVDPAIVQQVFAVNDGQIPRAALTVNGEDALGGGHIDDRHVLGTGGMINTEEDVAARAITNNPPTAGGRASAFDDAASGNAAIAAALLAWDAANPINWPNSRAQIIRGANSQFTVAVPVNGVFMTRVGGILPWNALPLSYAVGGGLGTRPLYAGDPTYQPYFDANWPLRLNGGVLEREADGAGFGNWQPEPPAAIWSNGGYIPYQPGLPLATRNNPAAPAQVTLRLVGLDVAGGFFIHSAWPA